MLKAVASRLFAPAQPNYRQMSNEQLAQLGDSDEKARDELVLRLSDDVLYFLLAQLSTVHLDSYTRRQCALDLLHEVWLVWLSQPSKFRLYGSGHFKAWLFSVARNKLIDLLRKQRPELALEEHDSAMSLQLDEQHSEWLIESANHAQLMQIITALPYLQREAISLQLEGFSVQQIADITSAHKENVKTRLRYARSNIAQEMQKVGNNDSIK